MSNVQAQIIPLASDALKLTSEIQVQNNLLMEDMDENSVSSGESDNTSSDSDEDGSDTTSTTDSADTDGSKTFEQAEITDAVLQLPRDLCEYESIFNAFFTEELWSQLEPSQRMRLQSKLPDFSKLLEPAEAMAEQQHSVKLLFGNRLQRFGKNPLTELQRNLQTGNYRPDIKALRRSIMKSQRREQRFRECERIGRIAKKMFIARERFLRKAYNSAPDEIPNFEKTLQRHQNQHSFLLNADTKICAVRARKRFYAEIADLKKQISSGSKPVGTLSADEEDKDEDIVMHLSEDLHVEEMTALKSAATFASTADKCIYDTFFQRRHNFTDEEAMRLSQYAKRPKLTNRNFKQYIVDYKRKKLTEPNLPEYETADIRLRDVCARAQIGGSFKRSFPLGQKPGRKPKPKISEPPALVPIMQTGEHASYQKLNQNLLKQQKSDQNAAITQAAKKSEDNSNNAIGLYHNLQHYDGDGVELQQEEVETTLPAYSVGKEIHVGVGIATAATSETIRNVVPKLEPILQRTTSLKTSPLKPTTQSSNQAVVAMHTTGFAAGALSSSSSELIQETHSCFFALIRDFFCATPNHRMKFDELKQRIHVWLNNPITALNDWYAQANNWSSLLPSAVKFLAGDYVEQPPEYVPFIEYKNQLNIYQWIGAGRDSDTRLRTLCNFWLEHRKELHLAKPPISPLQIQQQQLLQLKVSNDNNAQTSSSAGEASSVMNVNSISNVNLTPPPPPRFPTKWTVRVATPDEIAEFRRQERERFEQPHRAYTYRMHGYESIVGPVRGIYSQALALTKARGHSMMVDDRPNFVTILTLVRDATARLPNGEGTRADISELLKCSQYINPHVAENVMQSIVSGALDRLHTESDACVRYDAKRKIWIYLHRNRSEAEFERMHQKQQGQPKLTKLTKVPTTAAAAAANIPSSIVDSPATGAILNSSRKTLQKIVGKTLPPNNNICGSSIMAMPALVPATATIGNKVSVQSGVLPKTVLPVPPLKYNIPATVLQQQQQQQKSLLKTTIQQQHTQQRRFIDAKTGATLLTTGMSTINAAGKQIGYSMPVGRLMSMTAAGNTPTTTNAVKTTSPLTATVAGKRVALSKPIIINQINNKTTIQQQQQQISTQNKLKAATQIVKTTQQLQQQKSQSTQGYIIPISAANSSNIQMQLQPQFVQVNSATTASNLKPAGNLQTILVEPHAIGKTTNNETNKTSAPKNIIRFVQNVKQQQPQQQIVANNKIIGQRLIASPISNSSSSASSGSNFTIRGATKILTTTLNNASPKASTQETKNATTFVGTSPINAVAAGNLPGTIIKMSPQAFSALQQKQQIQHIVKTQQQPQQLRQQRLVIGNTAIIAHGSGSNAEQTSSSPTQSLTKVAIKNTLKPLDAAILSNSTTPTTKTTTTSNKIQMLNATSLTPQQQRILIQNLKQQQQTNPTSKPLTVVVPQSSGVGVSVTRLLKNTTSKSLASTSTSPTTSGKTITIGGKAAGQILTFNTASLAEVGNTIITPATPRNIIAIGSGSGTTQQQRLITTSTGVNKTAQLANTASSSAVRVIRSISGSDATTSTASSGQTTFSIANIQGKQVVFATKSPAANVKQISAGAAVGTNATGNSVVIGGQTIKLQSNNTQANLIKATSSTTANVTSSSSSPSQAPQLQTVIMGNQILRVLPQNLISAKAVTSRGETVNSVQNRFITVNTSTGQQPSTSINTTNSVPKTLVLNSGTQTIRFQSTSAASGTQEVNQTTLQKAATSGNRVVLAVPGGGQILLPSGGTLNLKSLQNMKLVSLAQVQQHQQQQQQEKTKTNTATAATTIAKT